jgi:predicted membrane GTPase involved in stress response
MNVSIQVEEGTVSGGCIVRGRGEFQLVILIETLRREGFELSVGRPQVIFKHEGGKKLEPMEHIFVDCAEEFAGVVTEKLSGRKGRMTNYVAHGSGRVRLEFSAPARALIGYRDVFLTDTKGTGISIRCSPATRSTGAISSTASRGPWWPTAWGKESPTACSTWSPGEPSSSCPGNPSTRA